MEKIKQLFVKYREQIAYVFFGGVATAVNIGAYAACSWMGMPTAAANAIAWVAAVLAAYVTNRTWVFQSRSAGAAMAKEFASFVGCRAATGVMDEVIMVMGVDKLGPLVAPGSLKLWGLGVKLFSNVLVIILNYVFSKLFIFKKKDK